MQIEVYKMTADGDSLTITLEEICDSFSSLLWDIEYYKCGSFEVYISASPQNIEIFQTGRIVGRNDDDQYFGIIESMQIDTDAENGDYLTVQGRFLMCLLERRIIHPTYSITAQTAYSDIVRNAVVLNAMQQDNRRIPGLSLGDVSGTCWEQTAKLQISYANLMEWVYTICEKIGGTANIRLVKSSGEEYWMVFDLSESTDRSVIQKGNPHIVFSDAYSNLLSFSYAENTAIQQNFAYIYGHGKGTDCTYTDEDFTSYLSSIICNGILDTYGQIFRLTVAASGLKVTLGTGKVWINGHYFINDAEYSIDLSSYQNESLPRYVAIAILLDTSEAVRSVSLEITPRTPAENPSLPSFTTDEGKTRLLMYAVQLNPDAAELTERDWYDYREDKAKCGYCHCILGKCKVTNMLAQITAEIQDYNDTIIELINKVDTLQTEVDDIISGIVEIGTCGENIHYVLYENGKLLLHGSGETYNYETAQSPFTNNENIRSLVVSDGITKIGNSIFERCKKMTSASFPTSLTEIGKRTFFMFDQDGLIELNLPASVTTISEKAFACESFTSVTLPSTLTTLGTYLFMKCDKLTSAHVECEEVPGFCFVKTHLQSLTLS